MDGFGGHYLLILLLRFSKHLGVNFTLIFLGLILELNLVEKFVVDFEFVLELKSNPITGILGIDAHKGFRNNLRWLTQ